MGVCLSFNYSPQELREEMQEVRWFAFTPEYDGAYSQSQHFLTAIALGSKAPEVVEQEMIELFKLSDKMEYGNRIFSDRTSIGLYAPKKQREVGFFARKKTGHMFITVYSRSPRCDVTQEVLEDIKKLDQLLSQTEHVIAEFSRSQDFVFGPKHFLAKAWSKHFSNPGAFDVPRQAEWFTGKSCEEAVRNLRRVIK